MTFPKLQLALDHTEMEAALSLAKILSPHVDIIEAGTLLCLAQGKQALIQLSKICTQDQILVADFKVADAAENLAKMAFNSGANWMTVMCAAPLETMVKALEIANYYDAKTKTSTHDIQIELFGNWTLKDAKEWHKLGLHQVIFHRGRDAQASGLKWKKQDLDTLKALSDIGFNISVTGGISLDDLPIFKEIAVDIFIVGRSFSESENSVQKCTQFKAALSSIWSK
ncbi:3-keto-L-gulonate 6-phosphate decarboxylase [Gammaproteobacteria bacterium]|nr:3-keto-L-gulonate 6-phosphate decarboxylase [Gammaproteobacteria bacterium]